MKTPGFEMYESNTFVAREYIAASRDPRAVAFMLMQLRDPKADETLRYEAYVNLARTGGEEGLRAVLAERNHRQLLRPIGERVLSGYVNSGETGSQTKAQAEKRDKDGRIWGLVESGVVGGAGDLWLVEKIHGKWVNPFFTGVSAASPTGRGRKPAGPAPTISGKTGKQLLDGAWFDVLVTNQEIRKDSDGDGLTDLVETRLGTDPAKVDTDGDGDNDQIDPWPNAANRPLTDDEQVIAAAFEARYHFDDSEGPGLFTPPAGAKPFEMPGRRGVMIWTAEGDKPIPLAGMWEQGTAFIRISGGKETESSDSVFEWNADHTEATFIISTYFGGLNGTGYRAVVRKFGDDWVVVQMKMEFIS